jgi:hypothetical protein
MPLQHRFDAQSNLMRVRAWAIVTERDFVEMLNALAVEPGGKGLHSPMLTTFAGDTSLMAIDMDALKRIRAHLEKLLEAHPGPAIKSAWVTADAKNAAVVRLWQALANLNPALGRHIKIFSNEDDALAWLTDPAP